MPRIINTSHSVSEQPITHRPGDSFSRSAWVEVADVLSVGWDFCLCLVPDIGRPETIRHSSAVVWKASAVDHQQLQRAKTSDSLEWRNHAPSNPTAPGGSACG
jgi:hypothetical protein